MTLYQKTKGQVYNFLEKRGRTSEADERATQQMRSEWADGQLPRVKAHLIWKNGKLQWEMQPTVDRVQLQTASHPDSVRNRTSSRQMQGQIECDSCNRVAAWCIRLAKRLKARQPSSCRSINQFFGLDFDSKLGCAGPKCRCPLHHARALEDCTVYSTGRQ